MNTRSIGLKLLVVGALAVAMTIPGLFVVFLVEERKSRAAGVVEEISGPMGGKQTFLGPTLIVPYLVAPAKAGEPRVRDVYVVFPAVAKATVKTTTEERRRSLFRVPVYRADLQFAATFDLEGTPSAAPGAEMDWEHAEVVVGVSNPRGALEDAMVSVDGKAAVALGPALTLSQLKTGGASQGVSLLGMRTGAIGKHLQVTAAMKFSGVQRLTVLPYGKSTQVSAQGDWPDPGFDGGFLPVKRTVTDKGFSAEWSVPFIARGVRAEGPVASVTGLESAALGVSFVEVADPYQSVSRAVKYVLLFVGLVFLSYFVLEVSTGKRIHPAQYLLVGVAQLIFYLLLLSLAERVGFDWAFAVAGGSTVGLLSLNARWVFESIKRGVQALGAFTVLYGVIYLLLRAEDNALLIGASVSFAVVAIAMYVTRRVDWYAER